jgi:type I restriction enzyme S subunit
MKASGVDWLGEVPSHWSASRLRFSLAMNPSSREAGHLAPDEEVSFVPMEAVGERGGLDLAATRPAADLSGAYTYFRDDDVVVAKITPCFENGKGAHAAGLVNGVAIGTTELHVLRPHSTAFDARFLFYLSISQPFRALGEAAMYGAGGQKRVPDTFIKDLRAPLPPLDEQRAIVAFLDRETGRIDALVAAKRRLIALLQEMRAALIARAVTRGLDPDVPTKESGVAWLGRVPAHWVVKRLRFALSAIEQGWSPQCDNSPADDDEWGVLKAGAVNGPTLDETENKRLPDTLMPLVEYEIQPGDVIMSRANTKELLGSTVHVESVRRGLLLCDKLYRLGYDAEAVDPAFLTLALRATSGRAELEKEATGTSASMQNIGQRAVADARLAFPPLSEQREIARSASHATAEVDKQVTANQTMLTRLAEYRSTLITSAVTGRIDVRAAA